MLHTTHLLTGATGFVGSALLLELLSRTDDPIVAIVRPSAEQSPERRLHETLEAVAAGFGLDDGWRSGLGRVRAVAGDISAPGCGVEETLPAARWVVWHAAASLQYQDRHREQIERTNIEGTRNTLALAQALGAEVFHHVSTAYVAGRRTGLVTADPGDVGLVNNHYERSKVIAEELVLASGLRARIVRPGIVIGHSRTMYALNYNGLYGFLRGLIKFRDVLERTQSGLSTRTVMQLRCDVEGDLGLVTVDEVAREAVLLWQRGAPPGIYHITNPTPPNVAETIRTLFELARLPSPALVTDESGYSTFDRKLSERLEFYRSYLVNPKQFCRASVEAVLGDESSAGVLLPPEQILTYCRGYAAQVEAERADVPVFR
ncbi:MAG: hypothetical protein RIT28_4870 [Pseudomonadota bacterium]